MIKQLAKLRKYNDWSIKVKLLTITILLILCSVLVVSLLSYNKYTQDFQQQSANSVQQTIVQLSYNIETYLNELFQLSDAPYYNNALMGMLEQSKPDSELAQLEKTRSLEKLLDDMMIAPRKDILSVYIISDAIYRGGVYSASVDYNANYTEYDWYKKVLSTNDTIFVPTHMEELLSNPKFKVFSIVKRINSIKNNGKRLAIIKVDADYTVIESICNKIETGKDGGLFIIDENNAIIYSSVKNKNFDKLYELVKGSKSPSITTTLDGKKYIINSTVIPSANWTVIALNSIHELNKNAIQTRNTTFIMALVCSILAIIILLIFTRSFLRPLMEIIMLMKEIKRGNFQVEFPQQRNDEIGYLGSSFNTMVRQINSMMEENIKLVREVYEAKLLQNEAQINALFSQIRPHFIYNTLNMISLLMQCGKNDIAIDNIDKLSDLMRSMTRFDKEITLEKEINLLDSYLSIQSTRYDGRLEYTIDIDKSLYSYVIPALTFQPIVENSVIHGCERRKEKTLIKVYATIQDDLLIFCVEDDANGMNEESLASLREKVYSLGNAAPSSDIDSAKGSGIGLINVNKRIKIYFGDQYGLVIDSALGKGTCVKIILPRPLSMEDYKNV